MAEVTTIRAGSEPVTLINVFTVLPQRRGELLDLLVRATEEVIQHLPGFVSANLHVGTEGTRIVNYAQWESVAAWQAMLAEPAAQDHLRRAAELAESYDPQLYEVASVHHR